MKANIPLLAGSALMAMLATAAQADDLTSSSYSYVVADNGFYNTSPTDQSYALDANLAVSIYGSSASSSSTPGVPALEVSGNSSDSGHDFANGGYATGSEAYINFDYAYQVENASGPSRLMFLTRLRPKW